MTTSQDDERPTTIQIRKWALTEIGRIRTMLANGGVNALPEDLRAYAIEKVSKNGDPWPNWLLMGLAARALRQLMEGPPAVVEESQQAVAENFGEPKPPAKKGGKR